MIGQARPHDWSIVNEYGNGGREEAPWWSRQLTLSARDKGNPLHVLLEATQGWGPEEEEYQLAAIQLNAEELDRLIRAGLEARRVLKRRAAERSRTVPAYTNAAFPDCEKCRGTGCTRTESGCCSGCGGRGYVMVTLTRPRYVGEITAATEIILHIENPLDPDFLGLAEIVRKETAGKAWREKVRLPCRDAEEAARLDAAMDEHGASFRRMRTLLIDRGRSTCNSCRRGADPKEETHKTVLGIGRELSLYPCGIRWLYVSSTEIAPGLPDAVRLMRPDLEYHPLELGR